MLFPILTLAAGPLAAQGTADQARLTIGIGVIHTSGGGVLWAVPAQPLIVTPAIDTVALQRELGSGFGLMFSATYAPGRYLGLAVDGIFTGLGSDDRCRIVATQGSTYTSDLCGSLENTEYSSSTTILSAGALLRPGFTGPVQPYAKVMGGFGVVQQSLVMTSGFVRSPNGYADAAIYRDEGGTRFSPYYAVALGATAGAGPGWQFRWEVRNSYLSLPGVSGATARQGLIPSTTNRGHHFLSFSVGLDIVLERKRGRRY